MDPIKDLLQRLENTKGDTRAQSALTAEFLVMAQPEAEREPLRASLDAAAILHWFDAGLLEKVLEIPSADAQNRAHTLAQHSFVEPYRGVSDHHFNLHESTRLGWRTKLAGERPEQFRALSLRASSCFADDLAPPSRIEWIYHLLCGNPDLGASELEELDREWSEAARPEDRYALAVALRELVCADLIHGRARAWSLIVISWARDMRGETAQLMPIATEALALATESRDEAAKAEARALAGVISRAQGKLDAAWTAFDECLTISREQAEQNPSNVNWQWRVAATHSEMGQVLQARGEVAAAYALFEKWLAMAQQLVDQNSKNLYFQRGLASAYGHVGGILETRGELVAAQAAFDQALAISRRLAGQDTDNAGWQQHLASALRNMGNILRTQRKLAAARATFGECLAIIRRFAEEDPSDASLQRDLAATYRGIGRVLEAGRDVEAAREAFKACVGIYRRLTEQDQSNSRWLYEFARACHQLARMEAGAHREVIALPLYEESLGIFAILVERAPEFTEWVEKKNTVEAERTALRDASTH